MNVGKRVLMTERHKVGIKLSLWLDYSITVVLTPLMKINSFCDDINYPHPSQTDSRAAREVREAAPHPLPTPAPHT